MHDRGFFSTFNSIQKSECLTYLMDGNKVEGFDFNVKVSEEPKTGIGSSREYFSKVVHQVISLDGLNRRHDTDSRNKASVGSKKPDYVQRSLTSSGEQGILCVGEMKSILDPEREFSREDVGQILDFLQEVLVTQPWRHWVFGFLTDGIRFEFFLAKRLSSWLGRGSGDRDRDRDDVGMSFTRSGLFSKGEGWFRLAQLLQQSDAVLGFSEITVPGWTLGGWLGSGATTSVFIATSTTAGDAVSDEGFTAAAATTTAVCKIYPGIDGRKSRDNEYRALQMMSDDLHTPKVASGLEVTVGDTALPVLIVTPKGEPLGCDGVRLPIHAFCPLVRTLRCSHDRGLCHIDVCGENMFAVRRDDDVLLLTNSSSSSSSSSETAYHIVLNDWASSMLISELDSAEKVYTHKLYYDLSGGAIGPAEDLAALVRAVFVLTQCTFSPAAVETATARELDELMRGQWSWGMALDRARDRDYHAVEQFFRTGRL